MKGKLIPALRWIGVLPAASLAYLLGYAFLMLVDFISVKMYGSGDGWMSLYVWPLIATGSAAYYFVTIGVHVSPAYKSAVALILLILLCIVSGAAFFGVLITRSYTVIFAGVAQIIGGVIGYYENKDE